MADSLRGVDISHWNKPNLSLIQKDNVSFLIAKCSEGTGYFSEDFKSQYNGAKEQGAIVGGYHYYKPYFNPTNQAKHFIKSLQTCWKVGDLPPIIDVEDTDWKRLTPIDHAHGLKVMVDLVEKAFGVKPIIYTGYYYWIDALGNSNLFKDNSLWVAQYSKKLTVKEFGGFGKPKIWQHSQGGKILGTSPIDLDIFFGDGKDLFALAGVQNYIPKGDSSRTLAVQNALNLSESRLPKLDPDGDFGNLTLARLNEWQLKNGFNKAESLTPNAWMKLFNFKYL